ncbi:MAG: hypothetical protein IJB20_10615 [Clostridia bacterium]|nr:hypothetical protein [Clostridia bacterium]
MKNNGFRKKWRLLIPVLLCTSCIACGGGDLPEHRWYEVYADCVSFMGSLCGNTEYYLYDMDKDGTEELFVDAIFPVGRDTRAELYVYGYDSDRDELACMGILPSGHISLYGTDVPNVFLRVHTITGGYVCYLVEYVPNEYSLKEGEFTERILYEGNAFQESVPDPTEFVPSAEYLTRYTETGEYSPLFPDNSGDTE